MCQKTRRAKKRWRRTFKVTECEVGNEEKRRYDEAFGRRCEIRVAVSGGARNRLSAGSIEEGGVSTLLPWRERAGWPSYREKDGEGEEAKRVTTARVEMRGEGAKWKNLRFPARGETRAGSERVDVGGGNLRQEAWSVRRSHPTAFHREATLIADVLEATMDVGHDDCSETYVGGGWKDAARSIRRIFIFLTLSLTVRPHLLVPILIRPLPYGCTSFFASTSLSEQPSRRTLLSSRPSFVSFLPLEPTRDENRTTIKRRFAQRR